MDSAIKKKTFERSRMMNEFTELFAKSKALIDNARNSMGVVVNAVTVYTSYLLGKYIIEEEQQGSERARYGTRVLDSLSAYLTKEYGQGDSKVVALDHVSFSVERGEFVAIVGASGSGKSTLMNMIGGIDNPTSGDVVIEGKNISNLSEDELAIFRRRNL